MKEVANMENMLTEKNREDLEKKGYTVVHDVISKEDCDVYIQQYKNWLATFQNGRWPFNKRSVIQRYKIAHFEPTWKVRLASKKVFEELWDTEQLLTSFDAVAIARPPETLKNPDDFFHGFHQERQCWLHCDQGYVRKGLHAYQGGVYLEEASEDDWSLEVLEGSHSRHDEFFDQSPRAKMRSALNDFYQLTPEDRDWFAKSGCAKKRIAVPKGAMVLWDSRIIHANAHPVKGRENSDRWRFVVFVCMTPKFWKDSSALQIKEEAYRNLRMTTHWPSNDIGTMSERLPDEYQDANPEQLTQLPEIAQTPEARRLAGVLSYPDEISPKSTDRYIPHRRTITGRQIDFDTYYFDYNRLLKLLTVVILFLSIVIYFFTS